MAQQQPGGIQIPWKYYTNLFLSISAYDRWKQDDIFDLVESAFHQFISTDLLRASSEHTRKEGGQTASSAGHRR
jgi:hypothetical protein